MSEHDRKFARLSDAELTLIHDLLCLPSIGPIMDGLYDAAVAELDARRAKDRDG